MWVVAVVEMDLTFADPFTVNGKHFGVEVVVEVNSC